MRLFDQMKKKFVGIRLLLAALAAEERIFRRMMKVFMGTVENKVFEDHLTG